jgi:hypothetical protein
MARKTILILRREVVQNFPKEQRFRQTEEKQVTEATLERTTTAIQPTFSHEFATAVTSIERKKVSLKSLRFAAIVSATIGVQILMMVVIFHYRESLFQTGYLAYPGIALAEFGNSAMILIPTPWPAYTLAMSIVLNPLLVGIIGGLAAAAGEMIGYFLGCKGRSIVQGRQAVQSDAVDDCQTRRPRYIFLRDPADTFRYSWRLGGHRQLSGSSILHRRGGSENSSHHDYCDHRSLWNQSAVQSNRLNL